MGNICRIGLTGGLFTFDEFPGFDDQLVQFLKHKHENSAEGGFASIWNRRNSPPPHPPKKKGVFFVKSSVCAAVPTQLCCFLPCTSLSALGFCARHVLLHRVSRSGVRAPACSQGAFVDKARVGTAGTLQIEYHRREHVFLILMQKKNQCLINICSLFSLKKDALLWAQT